MRFFSVVLASLAAGAVTRAADAARTDLEQQFTRDVRPFLQAYCYECHGKEDPEAEMDLSKYQSMGTLVQDGQRWSLLMERLEAGEMPPKKAEKHPSVAERKEAVQWFRSVRDYEIRRNAGDPGLVLARRLSNSEYDYSIRDLTGVDIRPTREFPIDPANTAGFDNSGESLVMSPTLLKKYIEAARDVANHMYLREHGIGFAPHPVISDADREKLCTMQIINFYHEQNIDYADHFQAAWRFKHRAALGQPKATLADVARDNHVSAKYLTTVLNALEAKEEIGPMVKLQALWRALPASASSNVRADCEAMSEYVATVRAKVETRFLNITAGTIGTAWQPFLIWKNVQYATHRRFFDPRQLQVDGEIQIRTDGIPEPEWDNAFGPGKTLLVENEPGDPDLHVPEGQRPRYEAAWGRFCSVFPDMFYKESRGRNYFRTGRDEGRYLSAGFHNVMGYFRDDQALYELILDEKQQARLDEMWRELDFVASVNIRTYLQFAMLGTRGTRDDFKDGEPQVRSNEESDIISEPSIRQLEADYLTFAQSGGASGDDVALTAIRNFFDSYSKGIAWVQQARKDAEPSHLDALLDFAARAYRRPLTKEDRDDILDFYHATREKNEGDHELAVRETIVMILMSPEFTYRIDLIEGDRSIQPLSDYDLASRLSYFLWSSGPDAELLKHAAARDLHKPRVIAAQAKRMIQDPRVRALAVEFGANWLGIRDFEGIGTVDRDRFPMFTTALKEAMYEEPIRFMLDVFQKNASVLDFLYADRTFVNAELARHYGMPFPEHGDHEPAEWIKIDHAGEYGRGGLLPMAVFLTKNAPGLRTSPVKRGFWVVKNVLGERIPPPPPTVPELPKDEAKMNLPLRDMLAKHRENPSCAGCHARFDSLGLVFEAFGPVGERRAKDLAGRAVDTKVTFPDGSEGEGFTGLRDYIRARRQNDFVENFCTKLLVYALGRSPMLSDEPLIQDIQHKLAANSYRFDVVLESIVTSRQFLNKRGRETVTMAGR